MGIKGLWKEIQSEGDQSLAKLAADCWREKKRPLRVAVDAAIWSFQSRNIPGAAAADLGPNHALRVIYYRLVAFLRLNIQAVLVFDGPLRPRFKRDKMVSVREHGSLGKIRNLLALFGFPHHCAPGEAEAECATLQRRGKVDAVISEDVDALMFGCGLMFRSGEQHRVTVYDLERIRARDKISSSGMLLIALMQGGDYDTVGLTGCGTAIASAAAKAGYGEQLVKACAQKDHGEALEAWRQQLEDSIRTNCEGIFTRRSTKIRIPNNFPNQGLLESYAKPVVSKEDIDFDWNMPPKINELYEFCHKHFEWESKKFIKTIAEGLLSYQFLHNQALEDCLQEKVVQLHSTRSHSSVDNEVEIRIEFRPDMVVKIPYTPGTIEIEDDLPKDLDEPSTEPQKARQLQHYDPAQPVRAWFVQEFVKYGVPEQVEQYDLLLQAKAAKKVPRKIKALEAGKSRQITEFFTASKVTVSSASRKDDKAPVSAKASPTKSRVPKITSEKVQYISTVRDASIPLANNKPTKNNKLDYEKVFSQKMNTGVPENQSVSGKAASTLTLQAEPEVLSLDSERQQNQSNSEEPKPEVRQVPATTKRVKDINVRLRESLPGFWAPTITANAQISEVTVLNLTDDE